MPRSFDNAAEADVQNTVSAFIAAGETFTSGHVTVAVRNGGLWAGTFGHPSVGRAVRGLWEGRFSNGLFDGYTRTMRRVGTHDVYVYHPDGDDIYGLDLDTGSVWVPRVDLASFNGQAPSATGAPAPRPSTATSTLQTARELYNGGKAANVGDAFSLPYNGEGYAQVPRSVTRLLGLNPGDGVVLTGVQMSGTCSLRKASAGETPVARLQPTNGQLRIRDIALMEYGVGNGADMEVTVASGELTLR